MDFDNLTLEQAVELMQKLTPLIAKLQAAAGGTGTPPAAAGTDNDDTGTGTAGAVTGQGGDEDDDEEKKRLAAAAAGTASDEGDNLEKPGGTVETGAAGTTGNDNTNASPENLGAAAGTGSDEDDGTDGEGQDAKDARLLASISRRDALARRLKPFTGVFDHSAMTERQLAVYGAKKLNIAVKPEQALTAINAYLHNRPIPSAATSRSATGTGMDSTDANFITKQLAERK